jgi:hypothetical protein
MIQKVTLPGGAYATNVFDDLGRLLSTALKQPGGAVLDSHAYLYDPASVEVAHSWLTVFLPGEATRIGGLLVVCGRFASSRNSALQFDWVPAIF